jgi:hypothetical protein
MTDKREESRTNPRTSLFAAAILDAGPTRFPVRIRNISSSGALVQGNELPPAGTAVLIVRGNLAASAEIRWVRDGKAGLSFTDVICVGDWLKSCASKAHQHSVDALVAAIRTGTSPAAPGGGEPQPTRTMDELAPPSGGLLDIQQIVTDVAERLAADPDILERHARDIQQLDLVASMLASLARRAPGRETD